MPDVQFLDFGNRRDGLHIFIRQAVPGVHGETDLPRMRRRPPQLFQRGVAAAPRVRVSSGVNFDRGNAELLRDIDRLQRRIDNQTHTDPRALQPRDRVPQLAIPFAQCEPTLRRDLLPFLRHERRLKRNGPQACRESHDLRMGTKFQIEHGLHAARERDHVGVLDMAAVLAQVDRNAIRARTLGGGRRLDRIGLVGLARFADGRDVINVDVETHAVLPSGHPDHRSCLVKRRVAIALLLFAGSIACGKNPGAGTPVPQSINESVSQFLAAVKANDQKRMGELWGTERGPAANSMNAGVLRQRLTVIQKYLDHTGYRIVEGPLTVPGTTTCGPIASSCSVPIAIRCCRSTSSAPTVAAGWFTTCVWRVRAVRAGAAPRRRREPGPRGGRSTYSVSSSRMPLVVLGCRKAMRRPPAPRRGVSSTSR